MRLVLPLLLLTTTLTHAQTTPVDLRGKWRSTIALRKPNTNDAVAMSKYVMSDLAGTMTLKIGDGNTFKMFMVGKPFEGHYTVKKDQVQLNFEAVGGEPITEQARKAKKGADDFAPITLYMKGDRLEMRNTHGNPKIVFSRVKPSKDTLTTPEEKSIAVDWLGIVQHANGQPDDFCELELRTDHTFRLTLFAPFEGKWALEEGKLKLVIDTGIGLAAPEAIEFTLSDNGELLSADIKGTKTRIALAKDP